jgi:hypothetical protein
VVKPRFSSILGIARGLNAIFMEVSQKEFKRIFSVKLPRKLGTS